MRCHLSPVCLQKCAHRDIVFHRFASARRQLNLMTPQRRVYCILYIIYVGKWHRKLQFYSSHAKWKFVWRSANITAIRFIGRLVVAHFTRVCTCVGVIWWIHAMSLTCRWVSFFFFIEVGIHWTSPSCLSDRFRCDVTDSLYESTHKIMYLNSRQCDAFAALSPVFQYLKTNELAPTCTLCIFIGL